MEQWLFVVQKQKLKEHCENDTMWKSVQYGGVYGTTEDIDRRG